MAAPVSVSLPAVGVLLREDPQHELSLFVRLGGERNDDVPPGRQRDASGNLAALVRGLRPQQRVARATLLVQGPGVAMLQLQGDRK